MWNCAIERFAYSSESTDLSLGLKSLDLTFGLNWDRIDSIRGRDAFRPCRFMWTREEAYGRGGWRGREIEEYGEISDECASNKRVQTTRQIGFDKAAFQHIVLNSCMGSLWRHVSRWSRFVRDWMGRALSPRRAQLANHTSMHRGHKMKYFCLAKEGTFPGCNETTIMRLRYSSFHAPHTLHSHYFDISPLKRGNVCIAVLPQTTATNIYLSRI